MLRGEEDEERTEKNCIVISITLFKYVFQSKKYSEEKQKSPSLQLQAIKIYVEFEELGIDRKIDNFNCELKLFFSNIFDNIPIPTTFYFEFLLRCYFHK